MWLRSQARLLADCWSHGPEEDLKKDFAPHSGKMLQVVQELQPYFGTFVPDTKRVSLERSS